MKDKISNSQLYSGNAPYIEALYEDYLAHPQSVSPPWRAYFDRLREADGPAQPEKAHGAIREAFAQQARTRGRAAPAAPALNVRLVEKQAAVSRLIQAYRMHGHLQAATDPIQLGDLAQVPELDMAYQGLSENDLDQVFSTGSMEGPREATLREILAILKETYTGSIAAEFMHIIDNEQKLWIQKRLESTRANPAYPKLFKRYLLEQVTAAEGLERYLHTKYAGQKRFSLEGGESLVPLLDALIQHAGKRYVKGIVIGMAHRGRLNVLTNIMGKAPADLFREFEGQHDFHERTIGDVKYHEGFSSNVQTPGGPLHLTLAFNPSHLEIISPVVEGSVRARQDGMGDTDRDRYFAVLLHGDASISGQGVVYETLGLSQTRGFATGGALHVVVNNRIGFTLSNPRDLRSTTYCTDIAKVVQAPVFHVNADDPEAVAYVAQLAVDYRMMFHRDVMIDLICFRRLGHNEADEPAATQPMMYAKIRKHPGARELYAKRLIDEGVITPEDAEDMATAYREELDAGRPVSENRLADDTYENTIRWKPMLAGKWTDPAETRVDHDVLLELGRQITTLPDGFSLHPRVARIMDERRKMAAGEMPMDWGCAENLAYASLLREGFPVRLTGQDSARGTFFHRHAALHDQTDGSIHTPLEKIAQDAGTRLRIVDSILSEEAVLGFEFGYSSTDPTGLVIWEAQFGDFVNVAQVVIDQFISSSEQKWRRLSGMVMMLPHGWEGQGPEHSSARLERFLQLCSDENMQVCVPTTPAQMFHLLRRQLLRPYRKPLIILSPKSLLRRKVSFTSLDDLAAGAYQTVLPDLGSPPADEVKRVVVCSGKVYYDLEEVRQKKKIEQVAILRVEQLYPFPTEAFTRELRCFPNAEEVVWTQEEPRNQGSWYYVQHRVGGCMQPNQSLSYCGRLDSAAPAGGEYSNHLERQNRLVRGALNLDWDKDPHPIMTLASKRWLPPRSKKETVQNAD